MPPGVKQFPPAPWGRATMVSCNPPSVTLSKKTFEPSRAVLSAIVRSVPVIPAVKLASYMPPPWVAVLPEIVLLMIWVAAVPLSYSPPPPPAWFPVNALRWTESVPVASL